MKSSEILTGLIIVALFAVMCSGQTSQELTDDTQLSQQETENELVSTLPNKTYFYICLFFFAYIFIWNVWPIIWKPNTE